MEFLAREQIWEPYFQVVRWRERQGIYDVEHDEIYVLAMINALGGGMNAEVLNRALREDTEAPEHHVLADLRGAGNEAGKSFLSRPPSR